MDNEPVNILPGDKNEISDQKLMDYMADKLSVEEKIAIDKLVAESGLLQDAFYGLQQFKNPDSLQVLVNQLNAGLFKHLKKKKQRRRQLKLNNEQWVYLAIIIVLLLAIISYIIIRLRLGG